MTSSTQPRGKCRKMCEVLFDCLTQPEEQADPRAAVPESLTKALGHQQYLETNIKAICSNVCAPWPKLLKGRRA